MGSSHTLILGLGGLLYDRGVRGRRVDVGSGGCHKWSRGVVGGLVGSMFLGSLDHRRSRRWDDPDWKVVGTVESEYRSNPFFLFLAGPVRVVAVPKARDKKLELMLPPVLGPKVGDDGHGGKFMCSVVKLILCPLLCPLLCRPPPPSLPHRGLTLRSYQQTKTPLLSSKGTG